MATIFEEDPPFANNPALRAVLDNHGLLDASGAWRVTDVAFQGQGAGPLLDPAVIEKFLELDNTRQLKVLDWALLAAGGGAPALLASKNEYAKARVAFIRERMQGVGEGGAKIAPMTAEQAEADWKESEAPLKAALFPADQDMLELYDYKIFGYGRYWPGPHNLYKDVYASIKLFQENLVGRVGNQSKLGQINAARAARAGAARADYVAVKEQLKYYTCLQDLKNVNDEFFYHFKRPQAAKDIQFIGKGPEGYTKSKDIKFYEDPNLVAYIPATAAAMMQVGFQNWCVANPTEFETAFHHDPKERTPPRWTEYNQKGPFMVIHFKGDMSEPETPAGHEHHQSLRRLAVWPEHCDLTSLEEPYQGVKFYDFVNRFHNPVLWPELQQRLSQTPDGYAALASTKAAMAEFSAWAKQMGPKDVKISVYEMLSMQLAYRLLYS